MGTSLMAKWLELYTSSPWGIGLIPGLGTKILQDAWGSQKIKKKKEFIS